MNISRNMIYKIVSESKGLFKIQNHDDFEFESLEVQGDLDKSLGLYMRVKFASKKLKRMYDESLKLDIRYDGKTPESILDDLKEKVDSFYEDLYVKAVKASAFDENKLDPIEKAFKDFLKPKQDDEEESNDPRVVYRNKLKDWLGTDRFASPSNSTKGNSKPDFTESANGDLVEVINALYEIKNVLSTIKDSLESIDNSLKELDDDDNFTE